MSMHTLKREAMELLMLTRRICRGRRFAGFAWGFVFLCAAPSHGAIYSETFDAATVPSNWTAQNGSNGQAALAIADDTGGINGGNALSMTSSTRQGVIASIPEVSLVSVGDKIELAFDARLTQFVNNSGGLRFGLYHDNGGSPALSSGYRILVGTGNNAPRTDVQADGGDADIGFGTNRENPTGFQNFINGINDSDPHSFLLSLTRTVDGVLIDVLQDGVSSLAAPVEHISGLGTGTPVPLQTQFNQIMFTTNGGFVGFVDNVHVSYSAIPEPTTLSCAFLGAAVLIFRASRSRQRT